MRASFPQRLFITVFVLFAMLPASVRAADIMLADLLAGGEITVGDKRFHDFANYTQVGDLFMDPATIAVLPISFVNIHGDLEYGIRFQPEFGWKLSGPDKAYDMALDFLVTATDPGKLIVDNSLEPDIDLCL